MSQYTLSRLQPRDVEELHEASENLAIVADALRAAKYANGPALIQLLIKANEPIVRVMTKGAAAIARSIERKQAAKAAAELGPGQDQEQPQNEDAAAPIAEG